MLLCRCAVSSLALFAVNIALADIELESSAKNVVLVELFTSEGCSSCPPADRWMSTLEEHPGLWTEFVPVVFHVDYWDYIGWKDRFANPLYGERQRQYAMEGGVSTVYTPGVMVNGKDWRGWRNGFVPEPDDAPSPAALSARVVAESVTIDFVPAHASVEDFLAHVALLGFDLESQVAAGENKGRKLVNDFVVLGIASIRMSPGESGYRATLTLPESSIPAVRTAISIWISSAQSQRPIQSAGGWYVSPTFTAVSTSR